VAVCRPLLVVTAFFITATVVFSQPDQLDQQWLVAADGQAIDISNVLPNSPALASVVCQKFLNMT